MNTSTTRTAHLTTTTVQHVESAWTGLRDRMRQRRAARAQHAQLWRELDAYHSPREIEELLIATDRSEHPDAVITRSILHSKLQHMARGSFVA